MKHKTPNTARSSVLKPPVVRFQSRITSLLIAIAIVLSAAVICTGNSFAQDEKSVESEFKKLSESRKERKQLIDFLIKKGQATEAPRGTLSADPSADDDAKKAIAAENKARLRMFDLIAAAEEKSPEQVGREFHDKVNGIVPPPAVPATTKQLLTLRGSASIGDSLAPELMAAFLKEKGYKSVKIDQQKTSDLVKVTGKNPDNAKETVVVEIFPGNSASAFSERGLLGKTAIWECHLAKFSLPKSKK